MNHFIKDKIEQVDNPSNTDNAYTLGPLQADTPCCVPEPLIRVDNLSLYYGAKPALEGVSLDIYKGCITALIGPSGCG
jgi:phosphate transport system ATP-binding protein